MVHLLFSDLRAADGHGVRVAQRDAKKGGMYRCTPKLFEIGVNGGDQGCASEDAVTGDGETKVGASCVHEEVEIKVGAVPTYDDVDDGRPLGAHRAQGAARQSRRISSYARPI